jgi:hypothetical protein
MNAAELLVAHRSLIDEIATKRQPSVYTPAQQEAQQDGLNQAIGQLMQTQQAVMATAAALAEAARAMQAAAGAPKRIEILRDADGRAEGAVVLSEPHTPE